MKHPNPELADIVVDWCLQMACNYRCHYCWFDRMWDDESMRAPLRDTSFVLRRWREFAEQVGRAHINFTGGEPTVHSNFIPLVHGMLENHTVDVCSNFSRPLSFWREFARRIDPAGCVVDASFHPQFAGAENFLKKVEALMRREFFVKVVCVAYPPQLGDLAPVAAGARGLGAHFRAQPFNGIYGGRAYPAAYSEEERETIRTLNENNDANDAYRGLDEDIRIQTEYFLHDRKVGGRLCWAGQKYIAIRADGAIQRCSSVPDDRLGNFYEGRFSFFEEPKACRMETCCCEWKWIADERDAYLARKNVPTAAKPGGFRVA